MNRWLTLPLLAAALGLAAGGCGRAPDQEDDGARQDRSVVARPQEKHLQGVVLLTRQGGNRQPALDPAGERILWLHRPTGRDLFQPWLMRADGSGPRRLLPDGILAEGLAWAPDGTRIVLAAARAPRRAEPAPPRDLPDYLGLLFDPGLDIDLLDPGSGTLTELVGRPGWDAEPSFTPDGTRVLFSSLEGGRGSLWSVPATGGEPELLLEWDGYLGGARMSPDGRLIVFQATRPTPPPGLGLYVCNADGSSLRPLVEAGTYALTPCWTPDGQWIAFAADAAERDFELHIVRPDGRDLQRVTYRQGADLFPSFSRDGRRILWAGRVGGAESGLQLLSAHWIP